MLQSQAAGSVLEAPGGAVAHGVVVVLDPLAQIVGDGAQAARRTPGVLQPTAVATGDFGDLAYGVMGEAGGAACRTDRSQPALRRVSEVGGHAIGISNALRIAIVVEIGQLGDVAKGIGHLSQMALGVVTIGGDVGHVGARAVDGLDQAEAVVTVVPAAFGGVSIGYTQCGRQR
ncbi:hypothetical protein D3C80_1520370 [compost metagenome]